MLKTLLTTALVAGAIAGLVAAMLQFMLVIPLIHEAELYEAGTLTHFAGDAHSGETDTHDHGGNGDDHAHDHGDDDGVMRPLLTLVSTIATYTGFALVLVAGFAMAARMGFHRITVRDGILWGLAGFAATQLMPALGLAPELPGAAAADLAERQIWWLVTAVATAGGLAIIAAIPGWTRLAGLALIALPHLIGAPHPDGYAGGTPPELSALFTARALAVGALAWITLGTVAGLVWSRDPMEM